MAMLLTRDHLRKGLRLFLSKTVSNSCGILVLYIYALIVLLNGGFRPRRSRVERQRLARSRCSLWNLEVTPYNGVHHRFHTSQHGIKLHYVEAGDISPDTELVIFIHGFPDSYYSWRHQLTNPLLRKAHLIALDLPGFGGSDSLEHYSASNVLNAITVFIIDQRARKSHDRCIIVSHDYGSVITFRLAAEAGSLISRAVIISGVHPTAFLASLKRHFIIFYKLLHAYLQRPFDFKLLRHVWHAILPVLRQTRSSHYVFAFQLPMNFARMLPTMGWYWWLRYFSSSAKCSDPTTYLSQCLGPSLGELQLPTLKSSYSGSMSLRDSLTPPPTSHSTSSIFTAVEPPDTYPESVANRKGYELDAMISYYRDGLVFGPWQKPLRIALHVQEAEKAMEDTMPGKNMYEVDVRSQERIAGMLHCPVIAIWGDKDPLYVPELVQEGLSGYFACTRQSCSSRSSVRSGGSAVVRLSKTGHWVHVGSRGREVVNKIVEWCVGEGSARGRIEKAERRMVAGGLGLVPDVEQIKEVVRASYSAEADVRCY